MTSIPEHPRLPLPLPTHRALDEERPPSGADPAASARPRAARPGSARAIVCVACRARVTDTGAATRVDGHHEHTFFNPAGVTYRVACFASAPGCRGVGEESDEFTWFRGHRWQVAVCAACGQHLGWLFRGDGEFAALITARIEEA